MYKENVAGIYLNTVSDTSGGAQLVFIYDFDGEHIQGIEWLPDGQQIACEHAVYPFDTSSSLWMMNRGGLDLGQLPGCQKSFFCQVGQAGVPHYISYEEN